MDASRRAASLPPPPHTHSLPPSPSLTLGPSPEDVWQRLLFAHPDPDHAIAVEVGSFGERACGDLQCLCTRASLCELSRHTQASPRSILPLPKRMRRRRPVSAGQRLCVWAGFLL